MLHTLFMLALISALIVGVFIIYFLTLRRVVPTNEVHIVQQSNETLVYGSESKDSIGNVYYQIPTWVPKYGVVVSKVPSTISSVKVDKFEAFDVEHKPFNIGFQFFFRISNYKQAASRIFTVNGLQSHVEDIIKGCIRSELSKETYEDILAKRPEYGAIITGLIMPQLKKEWGLESVKEIEIIDLQIEGE